MRMTHMIEIAAAFVAGVIVARVYWARVIAEGKSLAAGVAKKL
jgi:hypothetical protein